MLPPRPPPTLLPPHTHSSLPTHLTTPQYNKPSRKHGGHEEYKPEEHSYGSHNATQAYGSEGVKRDGNHMYNATEEYEGKHKHHKHGYGNEKHYDGNKEGHGHKDASQYGDEKEGYGDADKHAYKHADKAYKRADKEDSYELGAYKGEESYGKKEPEGYGYAADKHAAKHKKA